MTTANDEILDTPAGLRAALAEAMAAPEDAADNPDNVAIRARNTAEEGDDAPVAPRAVTAEALGTLAGRAAQHYATLASSEGEALCSILRDAALYLVDERLRPAMLDLASACVQALADGQASAQGDAGVAAGLRARFDALRPADDDAEAIARAMGMTVEEAAAFGLTGRITMIGLDEDELEDERERNSADGGDEPAAPESLDMLFRRDALHALTTTLPQTLQRYWKNQDSLDALRDVRRAFHTLKGDARVAAQDSVADDLEGLAVLAEAAEDIIDELLGDDHDGTGAAPTLPGGAFSLLGAAQTALRDRLAAGGPLPGEDDLLCSLVAMQEKSRAHAQGERAGRAGNTHPAPIAIIPAEQPPAPPERPAARAPGDKGRGGNQRLIATFLSEADKLMPDLHRGLARLSSVPDDEGALVRARTKLHTLKGGAALAGATDIERLAHACEDILELMEDYQLNGALSRVPTAVLQGVLDAEDALQALLDNLRDKTEGRAASPSMAVLPEPDVASLVLHLADVKALVKNGGLERDAARVAPQAPAAPMGGTGTQVAAFAAAPSNGTAAATVGHRPAGQIPAEVNAIDLVPLAPLVPLQATPGPSAAVEDTRQAARGGDGTDGDTGEDPRTVGLRAAVRALENGQVNRDALETLLRRMSGQVAESRRSNLRLRQLVQRIEHELGGLRAELARTMRLSGDWDALEKEEYSTLDVLLMQSDEALADEQDAQNRLHGDLAEAAAQIEEQAESLLQAQRALLATSMVPLAHLEARLDHAVRSVGRRLRKSVAFALEGGDVTLDSRIAEALFNPLMLLVSNAVDHGLEEKEADRLAAGKPAEGHVVVRGRTNGDGVAISMTDDGRGIDPDRVAAVAVSKGVVTAEEAARMTRDERIALIWRPGFSTAKEVGHVSGRGMGMKSVLDDVTALQGRIAVETTTGSGTTYTITLPRSLAMMRVLVIREGEHIVAVPIADLTATHAVPYDGIVETQGGRCVRVGARTLAVHGAHLATGPTGDGANGLGTLLEVAGRGGILVDDVLRSQYVPMRPAPDYLRRSCGLIGYTLGSGGTILPVLDVATLIERALPIAPSPQNAGPLSAARGAAGRSDAHTVLIVDDSQTMRRALTQTFQRAGFAVREATNGHEALMALSRETPSLVTLDMEMPGLDGLETLAALRRSPSGAALPVFMITSRQQARHRAAALAAGVTRYFTKPYDGDELVGAARLAIAERVTRAEEAS